VWRRHSCLRVAEGDLVAAPAGEPPLDAAARRPETGLPDYNAALRTARRQECLRHNWLDRLSVIA
jgi:hypothetical protein